MSLVNEDESGWVYQSEDTVQIETSPVNASISSKCRVSGIVQKYIVVTCNYLARAYGVTKLMSVADAKEKCPQLVLVYGEDLDPYREFSYKVTELLEGHCLLVERLGFDENFMDVTDIVDAKLKQEPEGFEFSVNGHIYNQQRVGRSTAQRLKALGLTSVKDLQCFPLASLEKEFGATAAQRLHDLSLGIDKAPVKPSGPPQVQHWRVS
ncbi:hypothetical protein JZ751_018935 [Albula glossodonta]|uniref:UmuC domain-containing protein n=1 Tax=Albula glossodonta TaxID=121402 RepID=A0A8T2N1F8_9TELE|nr:hypothetical protein JZ751_018935 [Albula glossodonta]